MYPPLTQELASRKTLAQLVATWQQAERDIREAHRLLKQAETNLKEDFSGNTTNGWQMQVLGHHQLSTLNDPNRFVTDLQREAWKVLVSRMEIRRVLSIERGKELDKKLDSGELLDITEENISAMLEAAFSNVATFVEEMVKEVFEILRPRNSKFKTNTEFDIGKKVILKWWVEERWAGSGFRSSSYQEKEMRALENVFLTLDGQGTIKGHYSDLQNAIDKTGSSGWGETEYFKFKCCKNRNLHLEFKRLDLVAELNQVAGGNRLYAERGN